MKKIIVCLAAFVALATSPAIAWNRSGDMDEVILGPGATAKKIQAALDGLPKDGGTVALRPGVYVIDRPLSLSRDNQTLRGAGQATVLRLAGNANCPLLVMGTLESYPTRVVHNLRVSDLDLDGNRTNQEAECWVTPTGEGSEIRNNGLTIRGATDCFIERIRCYRARSGGLVTEKGVRRLTVSDYAAWDNQFDGLAAYETEDSVFNRLILRGNPGAGLSLDRGFRHNIISDAVAVENGTGIFMRHSCDNLFQGLTIRGSKENGVFMAQTAIAVTNMVAEQSVATSASAGQTPRMRAVIAWIPTPNTECTGNVFSGLLITDSVGAGFLLNNDTCVNNVIQSARFARNGVGGLCESKPGLAKIQGIMEQ